MTTQTTVQDFQVNIDQGESIKRGIAAPHSTAKIDLDLAALNPTERAWLAARYKKGVLHRHPDSASPLVAPAPTTEGLLEVVRTLSAQDEVEETKRVKDRQAAHDKYKAEVEAANADPLRLVSVRNVPRDSWTTAAQAVELCQWLGDNSATILEPFKPYDFPERVAPAALSAAREIAQWLAEAIQVKLEARRRSEYNETLITLEPHLTATERTKLERKLLSLESVKLRLNQVAVDSAQKLLGELYEVYHGHQGQPLCAASDGELVLLMVVEKVLGAAAVEFLTTGHRVNVWLTTVDGRKIPARVEPSEAEEE